MDLSDAIAALAQALDELSAPAMLIGGIAVIARGIPRHTDDVDGTIAAEGVDLEEVVRVACEARLERGRLLLVYAGFGDMLRASWVSLTRGKRAVAGVFVLVSVPICPCLVSCF